MNFSQMIQMGYLHQTEERYSVLRLGNIEPLKDEENHVIIRKIEAKEPDRKRKKAARKGTDSLTSAGFDLFETLKKLRLEIAREEAVPPYIVFSDKTLIDMCVKLPKDKAKMLAVSGVGEAKYDKYGERFIQEIEEFRTSRPDVVISIDDNNNEKSEASEKKPRNKE